jgi:hypothetical protein
MKTISRFEIRQEYEMLQEALSGCLSETFLKADDPSISVLNFIEKMSDHMGSIKRAYSMGDQNRNNIVSSVMKELMAISDGVDDLYASLERSQQSPEDTNKDLSLGQDESAADAWEG